jgi:glycosyltransferase involved in cell wall biosynthesis
MHLAVVTPQPTPYRDPFWNTVAAQPGVELDVYYCYAKGEDRPWDVDWPWRFRGEVLSGRALLGDHNGYWNPLILKRLRQRKYDAIIIGGYNHLTMLAAAWYARQRRIPFYLMSEVYLKQPRSAWRKLLKGPFLRYLLRQAAGGLPTGTLAREYLEYYGMSRERTCFVPNAPDIEGLRQRAEVFWGEPKRDVRKKLGLDESSMVLFVGRLLALKNIHVLINAFIRLPKDLAGQLVIIGDGPEKKRLMGLCHKLAHTERVKFPGFISPHELVRWYCAADLFVLPSSDETWGVVVLESLACGTPVIVSDMVGSGPDVINTPEVGSIVPANDVASLARAMELYLSDRRRPEEVWRLWKPVADKMSHENVAKRLISFLRANSPAKG